MRKYRASLLLLALALVASVIHFYVGYHAEAANAANHNQVLLVQDYAVVWAKELFEGFPQEFVALSIELALLAGLWEMFKPYDEDSEEIKNLEKRLNERFDELSGRNDL